MASTINSTGTSSGIAVSGDSSGIIGLQTNSTTAITIDTSQNVGIGTTSPSQKLVVQEISANDATLIISGGGNNNAYLRLSNSTSGQLCDIYSSGGKNMVFRTNGSTENMRITAGGQVLAGTTTASGYFTSAKFVSAQDFVGTNASGVIYGAENGSNSPFGGLGLGASYGAAGVGDFNLLLQSNAGKRIYVQNRSAGVYLSDGGTSWTSNSDERIKKNLVPIEDAVNKVNQLRAVIGEYIDDELERKRSFLIAQDVDKVLPEAVDKTKDDVWGVQYADVIPLLVASIKELNAKVEAQALEIATLKGEK